jgi:hypothetical protein
MGWREPGPACPGRFSPTDNHYYRGTLVVQRRQVPVLAADTAPPGFKHHYSMVRLRAAKAVADQPAKSEDIDDDFC